MPVLDRYLSICLNTETEITESPAAYRKQEAVFKALADPTRRQLLRLLNRGARPAGSLAEAVNMSPAALSHHLSPLKAAEVVRTARRGQSTVHSINTTVFEAATRILMALLNKS